MTGNSRMTKPFLRVAQTMDVPKIAARPTQRLQGGNCSFTPTKMMTAVATIVVALATPDLLRVYSVTKPRAAFPSRDRTHSMTPFCTFRETSAMVYCVPSTVMLCSDESAIFRLVATSFTVLIKSRHDANFFKREVSLDGRARRV